MNLIFNDYIGFLKDKGIDIENYGLKEGYYWLDRQIIKAYDKQGNIQKIARLHVADDLSISAKRYNTKEFEIESWLETVERNKSRLEELEFESLEFIKEVIDEFQEYNIAVLSSGGKDSSVATYLTRQIVDNPLIIFNNTSLDCADTYLHIKKENNLMIINPKEGFYQWRERLNFVGNRVSRACCTIFKEGAMIDVLDKNDKYVFIMGMRNEESNTRSSYGDEWKNEKWGTRRWYGVLPIRKWTEEDIWLYMLYRNIEINSKYRKGYSRVGCAVSCPFYTKSTWVLDKYWYPNMHKRWHDILDEDFVKNDKWVIMNCTKEEYHLCWNGTVYREEPTEEVIAEFAEHKGIDIEIARKYFNKVCHCGKKVKKDEVALSMKYFGRNTTKFMCYKHLSESLGVSRKELKERVQDFKRDGCSLF